MTARLMSDVDGTSIGSMVLSMILYFAFLIKSRRVYLRVIESDLSYLKGKSSKTCSFLFRALYRAQFALLAAPELALCIFILFYFIHANHEKRFIKKNILIKAK